MFPGVVPPREELHDLMRGIMSRKKGTAMTTSDAARIQSRYAKANGGETPKGGFIARVQRAAARNGPKGKK